jgi:hypothetical protein
MTSLYLSFKLNIVSLFISVILLTMNWNNKWDVCVPSILNIKAAFQYFSKWNLWSIVDMKLLLHFIYIRFTKYCFIYVINHFQFILYWILIRVLFLVEQKIIQSYNQNNMYASDRRRDGTERLILEK